MIFEVVCKKNFWHFLGDVISIFFKITPIVIFDTIAFWWVKLIRFASFSVKSNCRSYQLFFAVCQWIYFHWTMASGLAYASS